MNLVPTTAVGLVALVSTAWVLEVDALPERTAVRPVSDASSSPPSEQPLAGPGPEWRVVGTGRGYFDVLVGDRKIGWGVCHTEQCDEPSVKALRGRSSYP